MLRQMIEKIEEMAGVEMFTYDGREYTNKPIYPVPDPLPSTINNVHTLTGLVDYLKYNVDALDYVRLMIHVKSPTTVSLLSELQGSFLERATYLECMADVPSIPFGRYQDVETFIIMLQAMFEANPDRADILRIVGNLKDSAVKTISDDGISQQVTVKMGISRVGEEVLPNPVTLKPYRSFVEIEQPESAFVFRMKSEGNGGLPQCALFEADGGRWKLEAVMKIKNFLYEKGDTGVVIIG